MFIYFTQLANNSFNIYLLSTFSWWWWWFSCQVVSDTYHHMDCSLPGFSVCGIYQPRILEWVAISFSMASS